MTVGPPDPPADPDIAARLAAVFPMVLRPSRIRLALYLAGCLAFAAIGVRMVRDGATFHGVPMGWYCAPFFVLGAVTFAVMLLPGAAYLKIEPEGFTVCSLFRRSFTPWTAVRDFGAGRILTRQFVGINLEPRVRKHGRMIRLTNAQVGFPFDGMLPDTYGRTAEDLAALMNDAIALAPAAGRAPRR